MTLLARIKRWFAPFALGDAGTVASLGSECQHPPADGLGEPKEQPMGRFQVFKDKGGQWRWRLRSRNGRTVAQSEAYTRKASAIRAVQAIDRALEPGYLVELPE